MPWLTKLQIIIIVVIIIVCVECHLLKMVLSTRAFVSPDRHYYGYQQHDTSNRHQEDCHRHGHSYRY